MISDSDLYLLTAGSAFAAVGMGTVGLVFRRGEATLYSALTAGVVVWGICEMQQRGISDSFSMDANRWVAVCLFMLWETYCLAIVAAKKMLGIDDEEDDE